METISEAWLPVSPVSRFGGNQWKDQRKKIDDDIDEMETYQTTPSSPEEKVVERMSMPRASIFASTGDNLTSINIMTKPKVEKKEEKTSITISRPTTGNKSGPWSKPT